MVGGDPMSPALIERSTPTREPAHLRALRLRARRRVLWLRHWWSSPAQAPLQGLAISDADVDRFLHDPIETAEAEQRFYGDHPEAAMLTREIECCEDQPDPGWTRLVHACRLTKEEAGLLALAVAVESDPWWRRVCGYLHDDSAAQHATGWLAAALFGAPAPWRFSAASGLVRWRLARPVESGAWSATTGWLADPQIDSEAPAPAPPKTCLYPEPLDAMLRFTRRMRGDLAVEIELTGPAGSGRHLLAHQFAAKLGLPLLVADAAASDDPDRFVRAARRALLSGAVLCWRGAEAAPAAAWRECRGMAPITIYCSTRRLEWDAVPSIAFESIPLGELTAADRSSLWRDLTGAAAPAAIAGSPLLPVELATAANLRLAGADDLAHVCGMIVYRAAGDLFAELPLPYKRDDLVVHTRLRRHLDELEAHARHSHAVLDEWEFDRLTPMGRGLAALFAGPSGTGKTMAAQVLAASLGLALRRVDLSSVVNKYIGETEKRLKLVFDACERSPAILFFDEADALFGQRTQVRDAHDRFANIEINYLLQRMEQFGGLAILATNRKEDIDKAFLRRLRFVIDFPTPAPEERREIWRRSLPGKTSFGMPLLEGTIDFDLLAGRLELTGAGIKSAALRAAFLARDEGTLITMPHVVAAARRELEKSGQVLRPGDLEK